MKTISQCIPLLFVLLIVLVCSVFVIIKSPAEAQAQTSSFTFGVAGDFSSTSDTDTVLKGAGSSGVNFFLGVGDLSYDTQGSPGGWGTYAKNLLGSVPFAFVMGNHDASKVDQFIAALPNPISNAQGTYGKQYYFDYPASSPLARFILISPVDGGKDLNFINTSVSSARSAGIKWIIVGMHQPCVSTGQKSCEIGQDTMDALTTNKVDVVLFGHDHNYQRSKQLTCAKANSFQASCVAATGPAFKKGAGSVLLITGTGGNSFYSTNSGDSEAGYFATLNSDSHGFSKFTISASQLKEEFVKTSGGSLTDSFTIDDAGTTPSGAPATAPSAAPSGSSGGTTPAFFPLTTCPTCSSPSTPSITGEAPTSGANMPAEAVSGTPSQTTSPCPSDSSFVASDNAKHKKHHKKQSGGVGNIMNMILKFLMQLINLFISLLGGKQLNLPQSPEPVGGIANPCSTTPVSPDVSPSVSP
jgi:hypothetical protein